MKKYGQLLGFCLWSHLSIGQQSIQDLLIKIVSVENTKAKITWIVPAGYVAQQFAVERSLDGVSFELLAETEARFDASNPQRYTLFDDDFVKNRSVFYRVASRNSDRKWQYSYALKLDQTSLVENADGIFIEYVHYDEAATEPDYVSIKGLLRFVGKPALWLTRADSNQGYPAEFEYVNSEEYRLKVIGKLPDGEYEVRIRDRSGTKSFNFVVKAPAADFIGAN
jgi:hypothetical protein